MNILTKFPLRLTIPLVLLVLALLAEWVTLWNARNLANANKEKEGLALVTQDMTELQDSIGYFLRKGDWNQVQSAIATRGADPDVAAILLVDDAGTVIASTSRKLIGTAVSLAQPDADSAIIKEIGATLTGRAFLSGDRMSITTYYPVILGAREGELRPRRVGTLFMRYDLSAGKASQRHHLERRALVMAGFYAGCFLLLGLFLHLSITGRVNRLVIIARRFAGGDFSARTGFAGDDELARLGTAFDRMAEKIACSQLALKESEQRYRIVFENSPVSIWEEDFSEVRVFLDGLKQEGVTDIERYFDAHPDAVRHCAELTKVIDVNRAALTLHRAPSKEELLAGLLNTFTPDSFDTFRQELVSLWNGETEMRLDAVVKTLDGDPLHVTVNFSVCPGYEETLGKILVSLTDITARKRTEELLVKSEARFRRLAENAPDAIYRMSLPDGAYEYMSPAAKELFGYAPAEFYVSAGLVREIIHPEWRAYFEEKWSKLLNGEMPPTYEYQIIHRSGEVRWMNQRNILIRDEGGRPVAIEGIVTDITERKLAEEELRRLKDDLEQRVKERTELLQRRTEELEKANERLKEADRVKSAFLAAMSHELRTPLNSIIGFSSILHDGWLGPVNAEQKNNLATIRNSGKQLLNMINDVLDVTRIEAGRITPEIEEFDLHDLLTEAESEVAAAIREKGLELRSEPLRQPMRTDRQRLLQCVLNILGNAMKFTDRGSVTVTARFVSASGETPGGELVEIAVTDTGIGIGEEELASLFRPFSRIVTPHGEIVPGTGLGLFLTRKIAREILKGEILVSSEYGKGSRFSLRIPVRLP